MSTESAILVVFANSIVAPSADVPLPFEYAPSVGGPITILLPPNCASILSTYCFVAASIAFVGSVLRVTTLVNRFKYVLSDDPSVKFPFDDGMICELTDAPSDIVSPPSPSCNDAPLSTISPLTVSVLDTVTEFVIERSPAVMLTALMMFAVCVPSVVIFNVLILST